MGDGPRLMACGAFDRGLSMDSMHQYLLNACVLGCTHFGCPRE